MTTTTIDLVSVTYRLDGRAREREFRPAPRTSTLLGLGCPVTFTPEPLPAAEDFALRVMADGAFDVRLMPFQSTRAMDTCAEIGHDFKTVSLPNDPVVRACLRCTRHEREAS